MSRGFGCTPIGLALEIRVQMAMLGRAMFAEVVNLEHFDVIDLPTGHWPMWSRPGDLAAVIESAASRTD